MSPGSTMKVLRYHPPGGPDKLRYAEEPIPWDLRDGEMLIKVAAVGVIWTELYWPIYQKPDGEYYTHIRGHDFSGTVEKIGPGFEGSEIRIGSEVVAFTSKREVEGALAEYAKSDLTQTVLKPKSLKTLKKGGVLININDPTCAEKAQPLGVTGTFFIVSMNVEQMSKINGLIDNGTLRTVVDSVFPFDEARKAYEKGASGNVHGKIVVRVTDE
jgi:NADPH:quinone reductase-like Zn-dependent oxidoreductase